MIKAIVQGRVLQRGERENKEKTAKIPWVDLYLENCGATIRVHRWSAGGKQKFDEVAICVNIYNGANDFYITFDCEVE